MSGESATELADRLEFAATNGASTGSLSMLDEAALDLAELYPAITDSLRAFSAARHRLHREPEAWPTVAQACRDLADTLRRAELASLILDGSMLGSREAPDREIRMGLDGAPLRAEERRP